LVGYVFRQSHVVQISSGLSAVFKGPVKEVQHFFTVLRLVLHLVHQDEGSRSDRPGLCTRLFGQNHTHARRTGPVCVRSSGSKAFLTRLDELAVLVLQLGPGQLVLLGVSVFNVADRVLQLAHISGHAFVALATLTGRPLHSLAFANLGFPVWGNFGQVVGPAKGRARTVGAVNHHDVLVRQGQMGVQFFDCCVVLLADLGQVDGVQYFTRPCQLGRLDAFRVDHRHHTTDHGREQQQVFFYECLDLHWVVRSTEIPGLGNKLLLTTTRTNRLVVDAVVRLLGVFSRPFGINWVRERRTSTGYVCSCGSGRKSAERQSNTYLVEYTF